VSDLLGPAQAALRDPAGGVPLGVLSGTLELLVEDRPGREGVDADPALGVVDCGRLGESDHPESDVMPGFIPAVVTRRPRVGLTRPRAAQ
jgi:hypothetical protein